MIASARVRTPSRRTAPSPPALALRRVSSRVMLSSATVVFLLSSVSEFQRREDDAVAVSLLGQRAVTPTLGTQPCEGVVDEGGWLRVECAAVHPLATVTSAPVLADEWARHGFIGAWLLPQRTFARLARAHRTREEGRLGCAWSGSAPTRRAWRPA